MNYYFYYYMYIKLHISYLYRGTYYTWYANLFVDLDWTYYII